MLNFSLSATSSVRRRISSERKISASSNENSSQVWKRRSRSFSIAFFTMASSAAGISLRCADGGGGSTVVIWYIMLKLFRALNGSTPVSSWYITTPSE